MKTALLAALLLIAALLAIGHTHRKTECDNPYLPGCSRDGRVGDRCEKCKMDCDERGVRPEDRNCASYCCRAKCECSRPCD